MWINVKDAPYSAMGDGTTNDGPKIQAAFDAVDQSGDLHNVIYFPHGTYRTKQTLILHRTMGTQLIGVGNVKGLPVYIGNYDGGATNGTNVPLTVRQVTGSSSNLTQWQNNSSVPILRVTSAGNFGTPDIGTAGTAANANDLVLSGGNGSVADTGGMVPIDGGDGADALLSAGAGGAAYAPEEGAEGGAGGSVRIQAKGGGAGAGTGVAGSNGEVVVNDDGSALNFRVESDGDSAALMVDGANNAVKLGGHVATRVYQNAPSSAPTDGNLGNSQVSIWVNQHPSKPTLTFRVKYSDGTLAQAELDLAVDP